MLEGKDSDNLLQMQRLHTDLERQFLSFNRIIPYDCNPDDVYSPRLVNIIHAANPQILGMFDLLCKGMDLKPEKDDFPRYMKALDEHGMLHNQKVALKDNLRIIKPFDYERKLEKDTPDWWSAYNDTKHDLPEGFFRGTLHNAIHSLAALATLHDIAILVSKSRFKIENVLQGNNWKDSTEDFVKDIELCKKTGPLSMPVIYANGNG